MLQLIHIMDEMFVIERKKKTINSYSIHQN